MTPEIILTVQKSCITNANVQPIFIFFKRRGTKFDIAKFEISVDTNGMFEVTVGLFAT